MKFELAILAVTIFLIANAYYDGKYINMIMTGKKYYLIAFYAFMGISLYIIIKKKPENTHALIKSGAELLKYAPIDRNTNKILNPILNYTADNFCGVPNQYSAPVPSKPIFSEGTSLKENGNHKRSVSETKKKYVASQQNWKCNHCNDQLTAVYEVDHIKPLYKGGDNSLSNLVALCRNCHGVKTMKDKLS